MQYLTITRYVKLILITLTLSLTVKNKNKQIIRPQVKEIIWQKIYEHKYKDKLIRPPPTNSNLIGIVESDLNAALNVYIYVHTHKYSNCSYWALREKAKQMILVLQLYIK